MFILIFKHLKIVCCLAVFKTKSPEIMKLVYTVHYIPEELLGEC